MKLYSYAVLMAALAAPAFCQSSAASAAVSDAQAAQLAAQAAEEKAGQAALKAQMDGARGDVAAVMAAQADAMALAREKTSGVDFDSFKFSGDLADAFSADKM